MCRVALKDLVIPKFNNTDGVIIKNTLPDEVGSDYTQSVKIHDDFYFLKSYYDFQKSTQLETKQLDKKIIITHSITGNSSYKNLDQKSIRFQEGFTTVTSFNQSEGFREYENNNVLQIRLIFKENFLKRNLTEELQEIYLTKSQKDLNLINFSPTLIQSQLILNDILTSNFEGGLEKCYIQAKALELFSLETEKFIKKNEKIILDDYDKEAIYKSKEILVNNIQNPPSITELSKLVHLNEVKLKKGFKQIFYTTPYKLLLKYKLNKAKMMLESGKYNINEVSHITGYKFANNFTNAFFQEFGILPKELIKSRKYYY